MSEMHGSVELGRVPFYLTQRLRRRDRRMGPGFDGLFACDYMGSAEFEWGALPESLGRIRETKKRLVVHTGEVTRNGVTATVYVVGDRRRVEFVPAALTEWMAEARPHGKEATWFPEQVDGTSKDWMRATDAWWALRSDVMWSLDAETANRLMEGIRG